MGSVQGLTMRSRPIKRVRVIKYLRLRWAGHLATMGRIKRVFKILTGKPAEKLLAMRFRCRLVEGLH